MFKLNKLFHPEDGTGTGVIDKGELGKEDMITFMGEDDKDEDEKLDLDKKEDKVDAKKDNEDEDKKDDDKKDDDEVKEEDELKTLEDELEEIDEDKLELVVPVRRQEILKKYPNIFKDFPYMEKAYYREQQYTELLPTIDDAKEAVSRSNLLGKYEDDLSKGDITKALGAIRATGEDAFTALVDNYLPTLAKVDKEAYYHVVGNVFKVAIANMTEAARTSNDEDLKAAAGILSKFMFQTENPGLPTKLSKEKPTNDAQEQLNRERQQLLQEKFEESRDTINTKVSNILKSTIEANIDPRESMTEYVKRTAIRDCQEKLEELLGNDNRLSNIIDKLWLKAKEEKFSKSSLDKIRSAYLSGAKAVLPALIKQARNEALKGLGKRVKEDKDEDDTSSKKGPVPAGRSTSQKISSSGKSDREKAREIPSGMSSRDFLMQD